MILASLCDSACKRVNAHRIFFLRDIKKEIFLHIKLITFHRKCTIIFAMILIYLHININ